jgi:1-acyl-sn-glycerol-3-phosphate acyltransferase
MFPEGRVRSGPDSVLHGGQIREGICRLAQISGVPVLPCVVIGGANFKGWTSYLPFARTRFAVAYGEAIFARRDLPKADAGAIMVEEIQGAMRALHQELGQSV